jgi:hypothetical protein
VIIVVDDRRMGGGVLGKSMELTYNYTLVVYASDNGCAGGGGFRERDSPGVKCSIAVVVGEVETRHVGGGDEMVSRNRWSGHSRLGEAEAL